MASPSSLQSAFMDLYRPLHERFSRYCEAKAYGKMDAKDLMSESLLRAYEGFGQLREPAAFLHFLFGIAHRVMLNHIRSQKFEGPFDEFAALQIPTTERSPEGAAERYLLYRALQQLPDAQREALILFEISGFSIKEIEAIQGAGKSAVKARLVRARKALATLLEDHLTHQSL
ncbi:MAG: RNA polymerase sigma factor [Bacteroidota bacterium]